MNNIRIEKISRNDIDLIEPLWNALKNHHQQKTIDYRDYYLQSTFEKRKAELLSKDELAVFVAYDQQAPIAYCVVSAVTQIDQSLLGELDSLYVDTNYRKLNLGTQLAEQGITWLQNLNVSAISLLVGQGNEQVLSFYEKLGFRQRATMMQLFSN